MSDSTTVNNQARPSMALPLILGAGGAVAGYFCSPFVKGDFKGTEKLVKLDKDVFQSEVAAHKNDLSEDAKKAFEKLETARAEYVNGNNAYLEVLDRNAGAIGAEDAFKPEGAGDKTIKDLKDSLEETKKAVKVEDNDAVKAAKKAVDDLAADAADDVKNAAKNKLEEAKKLAVKNDEKVKAAQEVVDKARVERYTKIEKAITEGTDDALKKTLADAKDYMKKINEGTLKEFNWKDLKKILPKAKGWGAVLYGIIALIVGRIIAGAVANKKNQA